MKFVWLPQAGDYKRTNIGTGRVVSVYLAKQSPAYSYAGKVLFHCVLTTVVESCGRHIEKERLEWLFAGQILTNSAGKGVACHRSLAATRHSLSRQTAHPAVPPPALSGEV